MTFNSDSAIIFLMGQYLLDTVIGSGVTFQLAKNWYGRGVAESECMRYSSFLLVQSSPVAVNMGFFCPMFTPVSK